MIESPFKDTLHVISLWTHSHMVSGLYQQDPDVMNLYNAKITLREALLKPQPGGM